MKSCSGETTVEITPVTNGYISPEAATYSYTKTTLAAPQNVTVKGNVISWAAVKGATSYTVSVGDKTFTVKTTTLDLSAQTLNASSGDILDVTVVAESADESLLPATRQSSSTSALQVN